MLGWGKPGQGRGGQESESRQDWGYERYMAHPRCIPRFPPCPVAQLVSHGAGDLPLGFRSLCDSVVRKRRRRGSSSEHLQSPRGWFAREVSTQALLTAQGCAGPGVASR